MEGREAGSRGGRAAAHYLVERMEEAGLVPMGDGDGYPQRFNGSCQNLLGAVRGSDPRLRDEWIVVGAHYDHVGYGNRRNSFGPFGFIHNGADDNASGVSTVLEVIDAMTRLDEPPARSVLFAFWDGEEKGFWGSKHWLRNPTVPLAGVRLAVNVDMVGRLREQKLLVGGTRTGLGLRRLCSSERMPDELLIDFTWEYKRNSDHWSFYESRIPSVYLHTGIHDDYHRPRDDVEKLNIEGMRMVGAYLFDRVCGLADAENLPAFRDAVYRDTESARRRLLKPLPAIASRTGLHVDKERPAGDGALLTGVDRNSPGEAAGLRAGQRVLRVNGLAMEDPRLLEAASLMAEREIVLGVVDGVGEQPHDVRLTLAGKPVQLGLSWREDPSDPADVFVTRVVPGSPAERAGLELGDRLREIDGLAVSGQNRVLKHVGALLDAGAVEIPLEVESRGRIHKLVLSTRLPLEPAGDPSL